MKKVTIDTNQIQDWPTFHQAFAKTFGFPGFYGNNMNAWIDCMSSLNDPDDGMTTIHIKPGEMLVLELENVKDFMERCPEQYAALIECSSFVNYRNIGVGQEAILALSFFKNEYKPNKNKELL